MSCTPGISAPHKTPLAYYGGKQKLANRIAGLIEPCDHEIYLEPFVGGAAVLFALAPRKIDVINDVNYNLVHFYRLYQRDPEGLCRYIECTALHHEGLVRRANLMFRGREDPADEYERAAAVFVACNCSAGGATHSFGFSRTRNVATSLARRCERLAEVAARLRSVVIHQRDGVGLLETYNDERTLVYLDPPYASTRQEHYDGWTDDDLARLLETLDDFRGRWILSGYPHPLIDDFICDGHVVDEIKGFSSLNFVKTKEPAHEIVELLVRNYEPPASAPGLFD